MPVNTDFQIFISNMTVDDIENVVQIEADAYGQHHWSKSSFYDEMNNNLARYYCAKTQNNKLVAYAGIWNIIDEAHITTIAVKPEFMRKHIGEALIVKILEDCYNNKIKYLGETRNKRWQSLRWSRRRRSLQSMFRSRTC